MKTSLRKFVLVGIGALALAASTTAQQTIQAKPIGSTPIQYVGEYHMASGTWSQRGAARGLRMIYNCTIPTSYYAAVNNSSTTSGDHLWIDEGKISDVNSAMVDQINGFDFSYCSTDLDPSLNSGSISISFYDEYTPCTTPPPATCEYMILGLPLSSNGSVQCWAVAVDLEGGFECSLDPLGSFRTNDLFGADRHFGWGFTANPGAIGMNDTGPVVALPCDTPLHGCSDSFGFHNGGNLNQFWWEDPTGQWTGCYRLGGSTIPPYSSFKMRMTGGPEGSLPYGYEGNDLLLTSNRIARGSMPLTVTFVVTGFLPTNTVYLLPSTATAMIPMGSAGNLLVDPFLIVLAPVVVPSTTGVLTVTLPDARPIIYVQAAETTGPATASALVALSNGIVAIP